MEKIKIEHSDNYVRDRHSKAILSADSGGLEAYKRTRERMKQIQTYGDDINNLKTEFSEIKSLLQQILKNQDKAT
jgi:hypothetical protein